VFVENRSPPTTFRTRLWTSFQLGGSCIVADDGTTVAQANRNGEEEIIYCEYPELIRSS